MKPEIVKTDHVLKKWMKRNRIIGEAEIKLRFGVSAAVFTHIYNGKFVSVAMLFKLKREGVPQSIINKLKKQGV